MGYQPSSPSSPPSKDTIYVARVVNDRKYRTILSTQPDQQVITMWLKAGEIIPLEKHPVTQTFYILDGNGEASVRVNDERYKDGEAYDIYPVKQDDIIVVPAETYHQITAGEQGMHLLTIYGKPVH